MVDLKKAPFFLSDGDIGWVKETIEGMTLDEKIGQLFFNLAYDMSEEYIAHHSPCDRGLPYRRGALRRRNRRGGIQSERALPEIQ